MQEHYLPHLLEHLPDNRQTETEAATRNKLLNIDGFGLAYYSTAQAEFTSCNGPRPVVYKTVQPPLHDINFRSLAANTSTKVLFAHIRAATDTPIVMVNNHPFAFGRHVIMHNGSIGNFKIIARQLASRLDEETYANVKGSTDSEHFAALYITYLTKAAGKSAWEQMYSLDDMKHALERAASTLFELQREAQGDLAPANSLNGMYVDGGQIFLLTIHSGCHRWREADCRQSKKPQPGTAAESLLVTNSRSDIEFQVSR